MGRRSVWSDPRVIALAAKFVPAADECWRLQRDDDAESRLFRRMARGHERPSGGSMQGLYVFAPGGRMLGRRNALRADAAIKLMNDALARWRQLAESERRLPPAASVSGARRWEDSCPGDGLVLVRTARDLAEDGGPERQPRPPINRDPVWFTKSEARGFLPESPKVGARHGVPRPVVERLARFHLVDNVRGQTLPFAASEVRGSWLETEVLGVEGGVVDLVIRGESHAEAKGPWLMGENDWKPTREWPRRLDTRLRGRARYDLAGQRFLEFELVAIGKRQGRTRFNARGRDSDHGAIGFVFQPAARGWRVPPAFIDVYDASWVVSPKRAAGRRDR